jgi:PST family polysaccharide transporter
MKGSTDVFINQLFPNLYNSFSVLLLGFWGGAFANGIFDAGSKFITISQQLLMVVSRTFFPYLSRNIKNHKIYAKLNLILSVSLAILLFVLAPFIIHLFFTFEFVKAIIVLRILSISIIFLALSNIFGTNYMIIQRHERSLRNITISSSIIGFIITWPLIYYNSYLGAALTIVITRGILGLSITYKATQIKKINHLTNK